MSGQVSGPRPLAPKNYNYNYKYKYNGTALSSIA